MADLRNTEAMTTEDLPGGSGSRTAHPAGVVPQPPPVPKAEIDDLRQPEFPIALRGYDRDAVDAYVREVNRVIADLEVGRSPQAAIRHALDQVSEETKGILERAHETADEITGRSRDQAHERIERAERDARRTVEAAEARARALDADADEIWRERQRLIEDVQRVAAELDALADAAAARYPPETEAETAEVADPGAEATVQPAADDALEEIPDEPIPPPPPPPGADQDGRADGGPAA
jgi:cell division initiation protein